MKILVVYKPSNLTAYLAAMKHREQRPVARLKQLLMRAHRDHERSLFYVKETLQKWTLNYDLKCRDEIKGINEQDYQLIVCVGGDGTLLSVAPYLKKIPVLALNSAPRDSVGFFSCTKAMQFKSIMRAILNKKHHPQTLARMQVRINQKILKEPILNEVLLAHPSPACTSRYCLMLPHLKQKETQRSSGIWVATAAGSSAAIHSAGGRLMPLYAKRLQYVVREPYVPPHTKPYQLQKGVILNTACVQIESLMPQAKLYCEGTLREIDIHFADVIELSMHPDPLLLFTEKSA